MISVKMNHPGDGSWGLPEKAHQGYFVVIPGEMERYQPIVSEPAG